MLLKLGVKTIKEAITVVCFLFLCFYNHILFSQTPVTYSVLSTAYNRATGSFYALGAVDNYWFLTRTEDMVVPNNPGSVVIFPNDPTYVVPNTGNNFFAGIIPDHSINLNPTTASIGQKLMTYRTYFTLPNLAATSSRYSLSFKLSADDAVYEVKLNGTQKAQFLSATYNNIPGVNKPYLLNVPICDPDFVSGQNYIDVVVADAGGAVGFYGEITLYEVANAMSLQMGVTSTCTGNIGSAVATITAVANSTVSYSWVNSGGTAINQTNNTSSFTNSITGLANGVYTVYCTVNAPCVATNSQTVNINCVSTPTTPSLCTGNLGSPVFLEDFGSGSSIYGPPLPAGVTNYIYQTGVPNNGTYVIASSSNPSGTNAGYVNDGDHTGNPNGYMMVVNSDYPASEVFRKHVTGLCQNTTYVFSAYLANNNSPDAVNNVCSGGYIHANIKFQTEYPLGTIQGSVTSGNLQPAPTATALPWVLYGFSFTTLTGQTSVDVVLKNNAPGGCGNDYVVDDISLSPCGPGVVLSITQNKAVFCPGEAVTLQSTYTSGAYTNPQYQWQFSSDGGVTWTNISGATSPGYSITSVTTSQAGMYQLAIAENGNINFSTCSILAGPLSFSISNGAVSVNSATVCASQSATLTATGATTYSWSNGATSNPIIVSPLSSSVYTVTGVAGTCTNTAVASVSVIPNSTISVSGSSLICEGQSSTLTAVGAPNYTWSTGDNTATAIVAPLSTSTYSVYSAAGVCSNTAVITVTVIPQPVISVSGNTSICAGESTTLTATGAMTYTWSTGATTASVNLNPAGTSNYSVSGSVLSCSSIAVVTITVNNLPLISQVFIKDADCGLSNGSATLTVLPSASTYSWSNNSTTNPLHNVPAGNYSVSVSNNGCITQTVVNIGQQSAPVITLVAITQTSCGLANGSATVTANTTGNTYNWIPAAVSNTNMAYGLSAGNYTVSVINGNCYTDTVFALNASTAIQVNSISIVPSDCGFNNGEIDLNVISGGTAPYSIYFNNTLTTSTFFDQLMSNTYTVTIRDVFNCREDFLLSVPSNGDFTLYVPNTFTPNKDKVNDEWYVLGACIEEFKCDIFNRWGEKIITLNNISEGWDGKYKGREVPDGVYVYLIEATVDGETISKAGHVTLFR